MKFIRISRKKREMRNAIKFDHLTLTPNGLILEYNHKQFDEILFSELHKSYIKKQKFSFTFKIGFLLISLSFLAILSSYFSFLFYCYSTLRCLLHLPPGGSMVEKE